MFYFNFYTFSDVASRLSAAEAKIEQLQTKLTESENLGEQKNKAGMMNIKQNNNNIPSLLLWTRTTAWQIANNKLQQNVFFKSDFTDRFCKSENIMQYKACINKLHTLCKAKSQF